MNPTGLKHRFPKTKERVKEEKTQEHSNSSPCDDNGNMVDGSVSDWIKRQVWLINLQEV